MARFYMTFDNSTNATLEGTGTANCFDRLAYPTSPSNPGPGLRTALLNARTALSAQFYAQIAANNQDGSLGIVVPTNGYTISGGNITNSALATAGLYTNTEAVYNSDLRDRPQPPIIVSNSVGIDQPPLSRPADPWTIAESYYTACDTAFQNAMSPVLGYQSQDAGGVYGRINSTTSPVYSKSLLLQSLWHDQEMTYFAWDDYTPGRPTSIAVNVSTTLVIVTGINNYEFSMDRNASITVSFAGRIFKGATPYSVSGSQTFAAGTTQAQIAHNLTGVQVGDTWDQFDVTAYYTLTNQGVYPTALGSGAITVSGRNQSLTNQSGTVNSV
jgi:hypothetical protein